MNRRRMMMLQQANGYGFVYDASSGKYPDELGWKFISGDYYNTSYNKRDINKGLLHIYSGHMYAA